MTMIDGDVVLILGGGSGLGLGLARAFRRDGAKLAILEVSANKLVQLKEEFGDDVLLVNGDVTSSADLLACRDAIQSRFGRLDSLIGCQGIFDGNVPLREVELDRVDTLFDELFHVNVLGYIKACRVFLEMLEQSNGAVVLTSSVAAYAADGGGLMYTATKGAVVSVVRQLAFEFSPKVRVNGVAPGCIAESQLQGPQSLGMDHRKQSDIPVDDFVRAFRQSTLMTDMPGGVDYAPIYAFLASKHNLVTTGQTLLLEQGGLNRAVLSAPGMTGGTGN